MRNGAAKYVDGVNILIIDEKAAMRPRGEAAGAMPIAWRKPAWIPIAASANGIHVLFASISAEMKCDKNGITI